MTLFATDANGHVMTGIGSYDGINPTSTFTNTFDIYALRLAAVTNAEVLIDWSPFYLPAWTVEKIKLEKWATMTIVSGDVNVSKLWDSPFLYVQRSSQIPFSDSSFDYAWVI